MDVMFDTRKKKGKPLRTELIFNSCDKKKKKGGGENRRARRTKIERHDILVFGHFIFNRLSLKTYYTGQAKNTLV